MDFCEGNAGGRGGEDEGHKEAEEAGDDAVVHKNTTQTRRSQARVARRKYSSS
jgi:hypothetical protein